ncbi:hypothetical protein BDA96_03G258000 [Sorghum bicolor]|uniref:Uncharacterized protein n=1 Tax=Sorghum bicolor TaxID=4558 RepID=A0A921RGF6_SORBI|nr:hypothetical protein BDA96_03G258000 [Sorghum bicolor]
MSLPYAQLWKFILIASSMSRLWWPFYSAILGVMKEVCFCQFTSSPVATIGASRLLFIPIDGVGIRKPRHSVRIAGAARPSPPLLPLPGPGSSLSKKNCKKLCFKLRSGFHRCASLVIKRHGHD